MEISILLRGQHFLDCNTPRRHHTNPIDMSFLKLTNNFKRMIIRPLKALGYNITFFISTYSSPIQDHLYKMASENKVIIHPIQYFNCVGYLQKDIVLHGLQLIPKNKKEIILILRFDLIYKKPITEWFDFNKDFEIRLLWRDIQDGIRPVVADVFFAVNNTENILSKFKQSIIDQSKTEHHCFHSIYQYLLKNQLNIDFCYDGLYDTNTSFNNIKCKNPVYVQYNRPYYHNDINISSLLNPIKFN